MGLKACPKCQKSISRSWYVFSGLSEPYRCIKCSTFIEWKDNAYFFRLAQVILLITLVYLFLMLTEMIGISLALALPLTEVISNLFPSKWLIRVVGK